MVFWRHSNYWAELHLAQQTLATRLQTSKQTGFIVIRDVTKIWNTWCTLASYFVIWFVFFGRCAVSFKRCIPYYSVLFKSSRRVANHRLLALFAHLPTDNHVPPTVYTPVTLTSITTHYTVYTHRKSRHSLTITI